jgi:hypothetical protein
LIFFFFICFEFLVGYYYYFSHNSDDCLLWFLFTDHLSKEPAGHLGPDGLGSGLLGMFADELTFFCLLALG